VASEGGTLGADAGVLRRLAPVEGVDAPGVEEDFVADPAGLAADPEGLPADPEGLAADAGGLAANSGGLAAVSLIRGRFRLPASAGVLGISATTATGSDTVSFGLFRLPGGRPLGFFSVLG
jgi:hypothetical protein